MIYPTFGISIFAHMLVVTAVKVKNFLGFKPNKKNNLHKKPGTISKIFVSLTIAAIVESVFFLVVGSSVALVDVGVRSNNSNFNIIKSVYYGLEKQDIGSQCILNKICYVAPNAKAPTS